MLRFEWSGLLNNLVQIGLTVSAAALVLFLLRKVMKKRYPARAICFVWAILAIRLLIPVQLTLPDAPVQVTPIRAVTVDMSPREEMQSTAQAAAADETQTPRVRCTGGTRCGMKCCRLEFPGCENDVHPVGSGDIGFPGLAGI